MMKAIVIATKLENSWTHCCQFGAFVLIGNSKAFHQTSIHADVCERRKIQNKPMNLIWLAKDTELLTDLRTECTE
jgi:hypothetical protein